MSKIEFINYFKNKKWKNIKDKEDELMDLDQWEDLSEDEKKKYIDLTGLDENEIRGVLDLDVDDPITDNDIKKYLKAKDVQIGLFLNKKELIKLIDMNDEEKAKYINNFCNQPCPN